MTFHDSIKIFLLAKRGAMLSERTTDFYRRWAVDFAKYAVQHDVLDCNGVTMELIQSYLADLKKERGLREITVNDSFRAIRAWFKYLHKRKYIESDVVTGIQAPKIAKKIPRTFTTEEVKAIFGCIDRNTFLGVRDYLIVSMLLGTGMRKQELCRLTISDVNTLTGFVKVLGKGNKERFIPLSSKLIKQIGEYMDLRKKQSFLQYSKAFFVNRQGAPIGLWTMASLFKRLKDKSGVTGERVSCHTWRHTFAKAYLRNGGDVFSLQKILGHSDLATTKLYLSLDNDEVKEQYNRYNPFDNIEWML